MIKDDSVHGGSYHKLTSKSNHHCAWKQRKKEQHGREKDKIGTMLLKGCRCEGYRDKFNAKDGSLHLDVSERYFSIVLFFMPFLETRNASWCVFKCFILNKDSRLV